MTTHTDPDGYLINRILRDYPYPGMTHLRMSLDCVCRFFLNGKTWRFDDGDVWRVGDWKIEHNLGFAEDVTAELLHAEIDRVLNIAKQTHTETQTMTKNPTSEDILANLKANPHPKQTHLEMAGGYACITVDGHQIAYDGQSWYGPTHFYDCLLNTNSIHQELDRILGLIKSSDGEQKIVEGQPEQTFVSIDRYRELEAELKTVTKDRDTYKARQEYTQEILNQIWDATGWPEKFDEPDAIEYIKRLKSKADLLSVVCRRLCGDENASIETVHKALDRMDDEGKALEYIGAKVGSVPYHLGEVQSSVAQLIKSLSDKTVSLEQTKQSLEWFTQEVEKLRFERDTERVDNKRLTETIEDLKRTTVKLPNEHTLRRLFNRHNTPDKYRDGTSISTMERLLLLIEHLESQVSVQTRRAEHMVLVNHQHEATISDTRAILDEHGVQSYAGDTYLGIPARIRYAFQTHTKV